MHFLKKFPTSFWVSNFMELFERMSFYGMNNVLVLYLTGALIEGGLGFSKDATSWIIGVFPFFLYIVPSFGGAMADRYGYKKAFIFALSSLSLAYFLLGVVTNYYHVFAALLLVSLGGAVFKPTLTGTISRTTTEETSSYGFGIYYMIVNIGGFLGPLVATILRVHNWHYVFFASSLWVALMLIPALFLYKDPVSREDREKAKTGLSKVLLDYVKVVTNWRFMLLLLIFSGFWVVFWQLYNTMTLYLHDYINSVPILEFIKNTLAAIKTGWTQHWAELLQQRISNVAAGTLKPGEAVPPELLTNLDAGAIILFQIFVSRITSRIKPLTSMVGGVFLAGCSMVIAGLTQNPWLVLLSILVLAFGEMAASPRFLEYVGRIAPEDKVALFLGYGFIPIGIGSFLAGRLGLTLYGAVEKHQLSLFGMWAIFGGIAFLTALALLLYNIFVAPGLAKATNGEKQE
ncbi:MAG: MFS transporter [Candidatus Xenobiia bacterium LiM19]